MMTLINNTDLKKRTMVSTTKKALNTAMLLGVIWDRVSVKLNFFDHSVGNLNDYTGFEVHQTSQIQEVDFVMHIAALICFCSSLLYESNPNAADC